ncbi:hypothetical protein BT96DRAFT_1015440 [Gymnopus androsaceus JB14]|uniref:WD40 repeat-like protein n=1 Tax=Gymnopus androsaceus JB14 TaxID=1447944 RepID=A0A6A4IAI7_9AGAR|nr:hypothetical protein BT96DRAFT_1015440 [Gymnopus androsaceus JB14]
MLAIASTEALSILDQSTLKKAPSSFPSCLTLLSPPIATSWSPDNKFLFIASEHTIHKYDADSNCLVDLFSSAECVTSLVLKDKASVVLSAGDKVHVLEYGSTIVAAKISQTFTSHKTSVNSLAISNDSTLLASTSSDAVYVHNLTLASHTALRGLPVSDQQSIRTCAFHPHARTRLLLGIGKQLVVYDTSRPSGPVKVISLNEASSSGHIDAIACSPFSKTLVAIATAGGTLGLVDLDKEKALFRMINIKVPLASLSFSQEDLRALDKPPKTIVLSETGARLQTMSVQPKTKTVSEVPSKPISAAKSSEPISRKPSATIASVNKPSPARRVVSASLKGKGPAVAATAALGKGKEPSVKKVFSPLRNPLGANNGRNTSPNLKDDFSLQIESLSALRAPTKEDPKSTPVKATRTHLEVSALSNSNSTSRKRDAGNAPAVSSRLRPPPSQASPLSASYSQSKKEDGVVPRRTRTVSSTSRTTAFPSPLSASASKKLKEDSAAVPRRTRTVSTAGKSSTSAVSAEPARTTDYPAAPKDSKKTKPFLSPRSGPIRPDAARTRTVSSTSISGRPQGQPKVATKTLSSKTAVSSSSRTPSPDLSDIEAPVNLRPDPVTPLPISRRRGVSVELGTPGAGDDEVDLMDDDVPIRGNKGRTGKEKAKVLFQDQEETSEDDDGSDDEGDSGKENKQQAHEESLSMQISPRRPGGPSASASMSWHKSPVRHSQSQSHLHTKYAIPGSPGGTSPQDLLRNIVRDVMYDFHQESRAEMMGLHLDFG